MLLVTPTNHETSAAQFLCFLCISALAENDVEEENRVLKLRRALQRTRQGGRRDAVPYLVVKGMIADAESVYMETMDIDEAKRATRIPVQGLQPRAGDGRRTR